MNDEHKIFHDRIQAWLSGELDAEALQWFETHRESCARCDALARSEQDLWELLDTARIRDNGHQASVWPEVREQVFDTEGHNERINGGWFFGGGRLVRATLAAGTVAAGLMVGVLIPGLSGSASAEDSGTGLWVSEASWLDETGTDGLAGIWLDPGMSDESDGS